MNFDKLIEIIDNRKEVAEYTAIQEAADFSTKNNPFTKKKHLKTAESIKNKTSNRKGNILNWGEEGVGTSPDVPYVLNYRDPRSLVRYNGDKTPLRTKPDRNHTLNPIIGDRYPDLRAIKKVLKNDGEKKAPFKFLSRLSPVVDDVHDIAQLSNSVDDEFNEYITQLAMGPDGKFKDGISRDDVIKEDELGDLYNKIHSMIDSRLGEKYRNTWFKFAPDDELAHDNPVKFADLLTYEYLTSFMNLLAGDTHASKVGGTAFKADADAAVADFGQFNDTTDEYTDEVTEEPEDEPIYKKKLKDNSMDDYLNSMLG